jgi:hypothetical protein
MTSQWLLISFCLWMIFHQIIFGESSLECWRCEVTVQSSNTTGLFLDGEHRFVIFMLMYTEF